jgi:hypothetical protein
VGHAPGVDGDPQAVEEEPKLVEVIGEKSKPLHPLVPLAAIAALVAANYVVFRVFDRNYFHWYLDHGAELALGLSLVALAVDLDRDPTLVAAHPSRYSAGWFELVGKTFLYLGDDVLRNPKVGAFDSLFIMLFDLAFAAVALSWMAVVAPLQYVVTLVTGAPARGALASRRIWVERSENAVLLLKKGPVAKMPEGAEEIGFAGRPVTVTSSITAGTLFVVSLLT